MRVRAVRVSVRCTRRSRRPRLAAKGLLEAEFLPRQGTSVVSVESPAGGTRPTRTTEGRPLRSEPADLNIDHGESTAFPATSRLVPGHASVCPGPGKRTLKINHTGSPEAPLDLPLCPWRRAWPARQRVDGAAGRPAGGALCPSPHFVPGNRGNLPSINPSKDIRGTRRGAVTCFPGTRLSRTGWQGGAHL